MNISKIFTKKGIIFLILFSALALIGMNINFSKLVGAESQFFTLFQFFGPVAGSFLGPIVGALSVLIAQLSNFFIVFRYIIIKIFIYAKKPFYIISIRRK